MTKKQEVIAAARELFQTYGYKKVSMDEIAKKSGVTKKTIYTYFEDKDDLIRYFLLEEVKKMKEIVSKINKQNLPFDVKAHQIIYSLLEYRKQTKLLEFFNNESKGISFGIANEGSKLLYHTILSEIKKLLKKAIKDGDIRNCDTDITAFIVYKVYVALMFEYVRPINQQELADHLIQFLKTGIFSYEE